jgi:hypothetical protein
VAADAPTIVATSGGYRPGTRTPLALGPLVHHAVDLAGVTGRAPRVLFVGTAMGDDRGLAEASKAAARDVGFAPTTLRFFPMPEPADVAETVAAQDVVWVSGGSVANLLAVWAAHDLGTILRRAWLDGVVLGGSSAGSICWFRGGCTDSFGPDLRAIDNGLGFLPYDNGVHLDAAGRRDAVRAMVEAGSLGEVHATDDGVGLVYRGTDLVEVVREVDGDAGASIFGRAEAPDGSGAMVVVEERLAARRLAEPAH